jgi:hypothetical protein
MKLKALLNLTIAAVSSFSEYLFTPSSSHVAVKGRSAPSGSVGEAVAHSVNQDDAPIQPSYMPSLKTYL